MTTSLGAGIPKINPRHPLSVGLCFSWRTLGGLQLELVNGVYGVALGLAVSYGYWGGQTTNNSTDGPRFLEGKARLVTSSGDGLGDFTLACFANPVASANNSRLLIQ